MAWRVTVPCFLQAGRSQYRRAPRGAMALAALSGDEQCIIFSQLCNVLDARVAGLRQRQQ